MNNEEHFTNLMGAYLAALQDAHTPDEMALYNLLVAFSADIYPLMERPEYFHKAFRQIDVVSTDNKLAAMEELDLYGSVDSAIWNLLTDAPIFWGVFSIHFFADKGEAA